MKTEVAFTFESEEGKESKNSSEESRGVSEHHIKIQNTPEERNTPQTPQRMSDLTRSLAHTRQSSHGFLHQYLSMPKHQRGTSDFTLGIFSLFIY